MTKVNLKEKIYVDETFSVNQLKSICKNMGLQLSGNKTTLIKRLWIINKIKYISII